MNICPFAQERLLWSRQQDTTRKEKIHLFIHHEQRTAQNRNFQRDTVPTVDWGTFVTRAMVWVIPAPLAAQDGWGHFLWKGFRVGRCMQERLVRGRDIWTGFWRLGGRSWVGGRKRRNSEEKEMSWVELSKNKTVLLNWRFRNSGSDLILGGPL